MPEFNINRESNEIGQTIEITANAGDEDGVLEQINLEPDPNNGFMLVASVIGTENNINPKNMKFRLRDPNENIVYELRAENQEFRAEDLFYVNENPMPGIWRVEVTSKGTAPFSVNVGFISTVRNYLPGGCTSCRFAVKALATVIFIYLVTHGIVAVAPATLLVALGKFLGGGKVAAKIFFDYLLHNMAHPSVTSIARTLCEKVNLCP